MTRSMCSSDVNRDCHSVFTISNRLEPRPACVAALHSWIHGSDTRAGVSPTRRNQDGRARCSRLPRATVDTVHMN